MRDVINQSMIWKLVGSVSAISLWFQLHLPHVFRKVGIFFEVSFFIYWFVQSCHLLSFGPRGGGGVGKRIRVSEKLKGVMAALLFDVICLISMVHEKLVTGESDVLSIIWYGSFALLSVSMSWKFELGFETGFSSFFRSLFVTQLVKINWNFFPIALRVCSLIIILRHYYSEESGVQFISYVRPCDHPNAATITEIDNGEDINEEVLFVFCRKNIEAVEPVTE